MRWEDFRQSDYLEDRRNGGYQGDYGSGTPVSVGRGGGLGIGAVVILGLIGWTLGVDPRILIGGAEVASGGRSQQTYVPRQPSGQRAPAPRNDEVKKFVSAVLAMNEDVWKEVLPRQKGIRYQPPNLVMFSGGTRSACGFAKSAMGPFYCPRDRKVYLDTSFFAQMKRRLGGGGDFAYAYVIAHEVGHHIENLLGILPKVQAAQQRATSKAQANALSVRVELMADCLAGVWAAHANRKWKVLEDGDIEKAIRTAQAIGDDALQRASRGQVVPDSFTHGSSQQRVAWLRRGLQTGDMNACNTFAR